MAKKVIQMYDKYKSTTKIYPKIIEECLPSDIADKIEDATKVTANPTLDGTESDLTSLEVGDTKYKVDGGKQLYQHNVVLTYSTNYKFKVFTIVNDNSANFTNSTFAQYLYNNNFRSKDVCLGVSGYARISSTDLYYDGVLSTNGTSIDIYSGKSDATRTIESDITDNVIAL